MPDPNLQTWLELCQRLDAKGDPLPHFNRLIDCYAEPHRAYHNLQHIAHCLADFRPVRPLACDPDAIELAIWFHDAVYDSHAHDNEQRSAVLAGDFIKAVGLPESLAARVTELILATRHSEPPSNPDAALLVDVDLSILGQTPERFEEYERQIRQEYDWVPADAFRTGRGNILRAFLGRPTIFTTEYFRDKFEARARGHLAQSIAAL